MPRRPSHSNGGASTTRNLVGDETGVNRVTQNFINNGTYIGGQATIYPDTPPFGMGYPDGSFGVLDPTTAYTVKLPDNKGLLSPGDAGRTGRLQSQLVATFPPEPGVELRQPDVPLKTRTTASTTSGATASTCRSWALFQDRAEYHGDFKSGNIENKVIAGGDYRYTRIVAYQDFAVEPFFYFDLYQPVSNLVLPSYSVLGNTLGAPYLVPGHSKYGSYLVNDSANQDSHIYDSAAFIQDTLSIGSHFIALAGIRGDHIKADDGNPALNQVADPVTGTFYNPGIYVPKGSIFSASDSVNNPSYFASLVFKISDTSSFYLSYNHVSAVLGSLNYGGLNVAEITDGANTPIGTPDQYHAQLNTSLKTKSILYEAGYKQSFLNNTLYFDGSVYQQTKNEPQVQGPAYLVKAEGVELDVVYQPTKACHVSTPISPMRT